MTKTQQLPSNLIYHLALLMLLCLELLAVYWLLAGGGMLKVLAFCLHAAFVVTAILVFKRMRLAHFHMGQNFLYIAAALSLVLPFYGVLGMYIALILANRSKFEPIDYFEMDDEAMPERYKLLMHNITREAALIKRDEMDIDAYRDILKTNDRLLEENTINKLSNILTRNSVSILKEVVKYATSDTKVLAATALIDMEDKVIDRIRQNRATVKIKPDDADAILGLARAYDLYCHLGVLDAAIKQHYYTLAIEQYETFLVCRPKHPQGIMEYGRALLNTGKVEKAVTVLQEAVALEPGNPKTHFWLAEAYYETHNFDEVKSICKRIHIYQNLPDNFTPVTGWWTEEEVWVLN